jgi:large subunit ribosomal protein L31
MKKDIHPQYYHDAKVKCACGNEWTTGSTVPEISVEICSNCHPFYTGKSKLVDTSGRVDKLKKRMAKSEEMVMAKKPKKPRVKKA